MSEVWRDIEGYEGLYQVSDQGRVKSLERITIKKDGRRFTVKERVLKPCDNGRGYLYISLSDGTGEHKRHYIHRLVGEAFVPNPLEVEDVNHKDENPSNNHASNLEWVTHKENLNYGTRQERARKAIVEAQGRAVRQLSRDGELVAEYESLSAAGNATGTHVPNIIKCAKGIYKTAGGYIWKYKDETTKGK